MEHPYLRYDRRLYLDSLVMVPISGNDDVNFWYA